MATTVKISENSLNLIRQAIVAKREDPFTRQQYFGELSSEEAQELSPLFHLASTACYEYTKKGSSFLLYAFEQPDSLLSVTRLHPEFAGMDVSYALAGVLVTSEDVRCSVTDKVKRITWKTYVTAKLWDELKAAVA